ncbi:uncharacterized protein LOC119379306 isoform X3 [Rhipicephalus sanguineus]|uniref:uncharacterized protein LOC119379306 isoform X3 n=1 Tax=Rhipicephalus sanguineus TaxID=34632 RepID=UPI001893C761|nr:uncharacterized protein LOC119379306 isoform X3 [Rhipicephalus sanguineus]
MSASSLVCKRLLPKDARKLLRAVFPVLKEKDEDVRDITEKLKLVFNHDLDIRLNAYGINVSPIGHLETSARGVIAYNVGTGDGISRWLRLSNRKFLVKGYFGVETCTYNSLGRVVGTAPYEIVCGPGFSPRVFVHDLGKALGSCAHVMHMELTQYGPFTLEHALPSYRWSWEEAKATSEKLHTLWYTHVGDVRNEMKGTADRFKNVARYF